MDTIPEDETFYSTKYKEAVLKYVEHKYLTKHQCVPVDKPENIPSSNLIPSAMALGSGELFFDLYDLSSEDEEYLIPNNVAETTLGRSDHAANLWTAAMLYLNSPPDAAQNWGQIDPNLNDYHSDPMEISSTLCLWDRTNWWCQQEETH